jgi:hypothetical protein
MRQLVKELNRHQTVSADQARTAPPGSFRNALRRPTWSKRSAVTVAIGGRSVALLLNPQGRADPEREQWLWDYLVNLIEGDTGE